MISALKWEWEVSTTPRPVYHRGKTRYPLYRRLGRPQGRSGMVRKISPPPGFDPRTVQPVASRCADWSIPAHEVQDDLPQMDAECNWCWSCSFWNHTDAHRTVRVAPIWRQQFCPPCMHIEKAGDNPLKAVAGANTFSISRQKMS